MVTENTTPNRGYQEPAVGNTLEVDVGRLIAALRAIDIDVANALAAIVSKAGLASPVFTGTPTAPTAAPWTDSGQLATTAFVKAALVALVDSAPGALDTLNELAAAIGDDPNFAATMAALIGTKADASATTAALGNRVRVDAAQSFSQAEKVQAAANIGMGYVQIGARVSFTNSAAVVWTDLSEYSELFIEFVANGNGLCNVGLQFSIDNGASWVSGASDYSYRGILGLGTSITSSAIAQANRYPVVGASLASLIDARVKISRFNKTAFKRVTSESFFADSSGPDCQAFNSGYFGNAIGNAVRLISTTGTWTGNATLWGRKG
ncbi:hypothetical protein [Shinella sp.]|uniref:hypothetical protein n=1 Tax=Shinella sp. TaxID=1870904 RepID=UPI0028A2C0C3|nr:hypothetical protein [Shinella sp.]